MTPKNKNKLNLLRKKLDKLDYLLLNSIKRRTEIIKKVINLKTHKNEIIDKKRISTILKKIKYLLKEQGMTINGVKKLLNKGYSNNLDEISNKSIRADNLRNKISNISKIIKDLKNIK